MEKKYTYLDFANEVIALVENGQVETDKAVCERLVAKATDLANAQLNKQAYAKAHPKKSTSKGASEKTLALVSEISKVLGATPMTSAEISKALGKELTPLQVANAIKFIANVKSEKVVRKTTNSKGLTAEKLYTAYSVQ